MHVDRYQKFASRTLLDKPDFDITPEQVMIVWNAVGLAGEAGEVAELVKKGIFFQQGIDVEKFKNELGDVLWYISALCSKLGLSMREVMDHNIEKLKARYPDGYCPERTAFK